MRKLRPILSVVLVLCMLLSTIPVATAEETGTPTTYTVTIDATDIPFYLSAPSLGNGEPSSYTGAAELPVEAGTTLADLGVQVWHDAQHEPYFQGWSISTWDSTTNSWMSVKDADGKLVILDTNSMLATPITEDMLFDVRWKTFEVHFEGNGGTFDMDMSDIHIGDDMAKSGWYTAYLHSFEEFVISDIKNGSETFYGWDVYEQVEDPNNPGYNLLNPVEGPISTQDVLARPVTYNVVYRANWTGTPVTPAPSNPQIRIEANGVHFNVTGYGSITECYSTLDIPFTPGESLNSLGIGISHNAVHEQYFNGWTIQVGDTALPGTYSTADMLAYQIQSPDTVFIAEWENSYTSLVWLTVHGEGQFDLTYEDDGGRHTMEDISYDSRPTPNPGDSFASVGVTAITYPVHPDGLAFEGWYAYFRGPTDAEFDTTPLNELNPDGTIKALTTAEVLAYTNTRVGYTDFIAKFAGVEIDPNNRFGGPQGPTTTPAQDNIIISSNNGSPFKLTDTDGNTETFPGYFGLNSNDFTDEFSNFSDLGLASIDLDDSTPFACWEVLRPVFDSDGNVLEWVPDTDDQGNAIILPNKDLILTWPINDGVMFLADWIAGGNSGTPGQPSGGLAISSDGTFDIYRTNPQNGQVEKWADDASHTREDMDVYVGDTLADFGITDITDIKYWDGKREFLGWEAYSWLPVDEYSNVWGPLYNRLFTTAEVLAYPAEEEYIEFVAVWAGDDADYYTNVHFNAMGGTFPVTAFDFTEEGPVALGTIPMDGVYNEACMENGQSIKEQRLSDCYPLADPTREGYTFEGWLAVYEDQYWHEMSDKLYTTEQVVNLPIPKENVQYLAKWKEISMEDYRFGSPYFPYDGSYSELYYLANGGTFNVTVNFNNGSPSTYSSPYISYTTNGSLTFEESQQQGVVQRTFELADKTNFEGWTTYQADQIFAVSIRKGDKLNVLGENLTVFKAGDEKYEDENGDFIQAEVYLLLKNATVYSKTMTPQDAMKLKGDKFYATVAQWHVASSTLANVKAATCTTEGYTGDKVCANCGEVLEKGKAIEKLAHTEVAVAGKAPTCTETGLTEGKKCSVCATVTVEQTVIATVSHTLTKVEAVAPTYTAAGNIEYYACACGALFADAEGKTATTAEAVKLAQLIKIEETKAEVSADAVDTAIKEAETTGSITIDLVEIAQEEAAKPESGSGSDATTKPAPVVSSAALPVASLQKVAEISEETTLTVNMTEVSVTMDAKTLAAVAEQSAGETVTLKVEKVETETLTEEQQAVIEDKEVAIVVSATLISDNVAISDFKGGTVTISIPFTLPEGADGSDFQIYYLADDGTMTAHDTKYVNGCLVFSTTHFSDYVVVNTAKSVDPTVPNTGDNSHLMFFTTMLLIAAAGVYLTSRKMRRA